MGSRTGKAAFCNPQNAVGVALRDPEAVDLDRAWLARFRLWVPEHGLGWSRATSGKSSEGLVGPHRGWLAGGKGLAW